MGRTNPTYRDLLRRTAERWETFRRGLRREERRRFDDLWEHAHRHADASGLLNHPDPIVPALFSMALEHQRRIDELGARLDAVEDDREGGGDEAECNDADGD
ncbi:hypothetical protein G9464_09800 [Halostella sp. JP-L12]|uniref:hypothetical protein n=1 Tax=Halostella TaxID=1843185 RepID=UPI000EF7C330|nr:MULTISPECIES: hypothetical protein [Halostella]NHN47890.1 hypothetical protein [Halostella sp. JP-L12]